MSNQNELLTLHGRLLAGDVRAGSKIVEQTIALLVGIVTREVQGLHDIQDVEQACFDALFDYLSAPNKYDARRAGLMTYLVAIAKGKAKTMRRSQQRQVRLETEYAQNTSEEKAATEAEFDEDEMLRLIDWNRFGGDLIKDPGDAAIVALMKVSAHSDAAVAQAIGLPTDTAGLAEATKRIERIRGRARRTAERKP